MSRACLALLLHQPIPVAIRIEMPPTAVVVLPVTLGSANDSLGSNGGPGKVVLFVVLGLLLACALPMLCGGSIHRCIGRREMTYRSESGGGVGLRLTPWSTLAERERRLRKPKIWNARLRTPELTEKGPTWNEMKVGQHVCTSASLMY